MNRLKEKPFYLTDEDIEWVNKTRDSMSFDEKVGQLFCLITYTDDEGYLTMLNQKYHVGGFMTRTMSLEEMINTTNRGQATAKIPLLISANLEAGANQAIATGTKVGCNMAIAATNDPKYAREMGRVIGEEATAVGLNWAFAPVIDIDSNWRNPITNTRTFGNDPKKVAAMGKAYVETVESYGIATSIKHFPGDGQDERDQHLLASINTMSHEKWDETYGYVYKTCIDAGAKTVMVGHIMQPSYSKFLNPSLKDEEVMPGLIAKELLQDLLRKKLGFNGMVVTDSSAMAGIGSVMPRELALPLCISAGCDMILFTKNIDEDFKFIADAIKDGRISEERLNEALTNILALKASLKLHKKQFHYSLEEAKKVIGCADHLEAAKEVADHSITIVKEQKGVLPLDPKKYKSILVYCKEGGASAVGAGSTTGATKHFVDKLKERGFNAEIFVPAKGFEGIMQPVGDMYKKYDLMIYVMSIATKSNQTVVRIEWAEPMGADCPIFMNSIPTLGISLENPYHLADMPRMKTYINTYGGTDVVIDSLLDKLTGKSEFKGVSPTDAFCGMWDTHL